jgi:AcrR family transcriptional regulator
MLPAMKTAKASRRPNAIKRATADARPGDNRDKLLKVGTRLFAQRGIANVSVEQLLNGADISRATFYGFFENKSELAAAILIPVFESGADELAKLATLPPRIAATRLIDTYLALWKEHREALLLTVAFDATSFAYIKNKHDAFNSALQDVLDMIEAAGLLRNDSAELTSRVIAKTAIPLLRVYKDSDVLEHLYRESMLALLLKN